MHTMSVAKCSALGKGNLVMTYGPYYKQQEHSTGFGACLERQYRGSLGVQLDRTHRSSACGYGLKQNSGGSHLLESP